MTPAPRGAEPARLRAAVRSPWSQAERSPAAGRGPRTVHPGWRREAEGGIGLDRGGVSEQRSPPALLVDVESLEINLFDAAF